MSAVAEELRVSRRIRERHRLAAVDDDGLLAVQERRLLVAGINLVNFGMEIKSVRRGPLDLNDRQYEVIRDQPEGRPPFVVQFTCPPDYPWASRWWPLRDDAVRALCSYSGVVMTEAEMEAFTYALTTGQSGTRTEVQSAEWLDRFENTFRTNARPQPCCACEHDVEPGDGTLLVPWGGDRRSPSVAHRACMAYEVTVVTDNGLPAMRSLGLDTELPAMDVWPEVVPLNTPYNSPPRSRPAFTSAASSYVRAHNLGLRVGSSEVHVEPPPNLHAVPDPGARAERMARRFGRDPR